MDIVLRVSDLSIAFGEQTVVNGVNFSLKRGTTLGVVGESGSGKSMTALSILGLLPEGGTQKSGSIELYTNGKSIDIAQADEEELRKIRGRRISLIFQEPFSALNPTMRCGLQIREMTDEHLSLSKSESTEKILGILSKVGIEDPLRVFGSYPHELSGGQLQRVLIAMAVSCEPDIIIADEPTTALDVTVQKSVLKLFKDLQEELQCSLIFISHDLGVIKEVADEVLVMQKGEVVEYGDISKVFHNPEALYTKGLLACRPPLNQILYRLPTVEEYLKGTEVQGTARELTLDDITLRLKKIQDHKPMIVVRDLRVEYPLKTNFWGKVIKSKVAVAGVNFNVFRGETLGLVGESGSGKSSLGKALLRLNPHADGVVQINGEDLYKMSSKDVKGMRKKIQIIFQDPYSTLNPKMKIGSAIEEVLIVHKRGGDAIARRKMVEELLVTCGMDADHYDRYPHQFSGGQRQRISIARTLAVDPDFIICDESVSALDVSVQAQILNLLKDLQEQRGLTYLFISHDLSVIRHMSDRVLVMKSGEIVEEGPVVQVFDNPQSDYTRKLIDAIPAQNA